MSEIVFTPADEPARAPAEHCPGCGRFAKYLAVRRSYNGTYDCATLRLSCGKCGTVEIELV